MFFEHFAKLTDQMLCNVVVLLLIFLIIVFFFLFLFLLRVLLVRYQVASGLGVNKTHYNGVWSLVSLK